LGAALELRAALKALAAAIAGLAALSTALELAAGLKALLASSLALTAALALTASLERGTTLGALPAAPAGRSALAFAASRGLSLLGALPAFLVTMLVAFVLIGRRIGQAGDGPGDREHGAGGTKKVAKAHGVVSAARFSRPPRPSLDRSFT
jgi:hypothetical protein